MAKKSVTDLQVEGKKVIVRVDFNVPHKGSEITDDTRIRAALPTISYLVDHKAKVVLLSHLGKVNHKDPEKTEADKAKNDMSIVATRLQELMPNSKVTFVNATRGAELEAAVADCKEGDIVLMQNTRYEKGESKNDPELGAYWASLADLFVCDAFGSVHRAHASTVGIPTHLPSAVGFLVEKELKFLGDAVENPVRPFVGILGGAKVADKLKVISNLLEKCDTLIIGGGMAYTFYAAKGIKVGNSLVEKDKIDVAKQILDKAGDKLVLPIDNVVADKFNNDADTKVVEGDIDDGWMALDIGPKSVEEFKNVLKDAKTVVWNGPMGVFEMPNFAKGTLEIGKFLGTLTDATTIVGGGDSTAAVKELGVADKLTHISTGGGASLTYLEGNELPGIAAISDK